MTETKFHSFIRLLTVFALSAVFIFASYEKIKDPAGFVSDLNNYHLLPWWLKNAVALIFPWWELIAAVALLIPNWRKAGALMTLMMGLIFVVAVSQALVRNLDISCGCFGHGVNGAKAGIRTLLIDAGVIIASLYILAAPRRETPVEQPLEPANATASHAV